MDDDLSQEAVLKCIDYDKQDQEPTQSQHNSLTYSDLSGSMPTFWRLKRKLDNIRKFYPELYYGQQNIIELYGKSSNKSSENSESLEYDTDGSDFIWI